MNVSFYLTMLLYRKGEIIGRPIVAQLGNEPVSGYGLQVFFHDASSLRNFQERPSSFAVQSKLIAFTLACDYAGPLSDCATDGDIINSYIRVTQADDDAQVVDMRATATVQSVPSCTRTSVNILIPGARLGRGVFAHDAPVFEVLVELIDADGQPIRYSMPQNLLVQWSGDRIQPSSVIPVKTREGSNLYRAFIAQSERAVQGNYSLEVTMNGVPDTDSSAVEQCQIYRQVVTAMCSSGFRADDISGVCMQAKDTLSIAAAKLTAAAADSGLCSSTVLIIVVVVGAAVILGLSVGVVILHRQVARKEDSASVEHSAPPPAPPMQLLAVPARPSQLPVAVASPDPSVLAASSADHNLETSRLDLHGSPADQPAEPPAAAAVRSLKGIAEIRGRAVGAPRAASPSKLRSHIQSNSSPEDLKEDLPAQLNESGAPSSPPASLAPGASPNFRALKESLVARKHAALSSPTLDAEAEAFLALALEADGNDLGPLDDDDPLADPRAPTSTLVGETIICVPASSRSLSASSSFHSVDGPDEISHPSAMPTSERELPSCPPGLDPCIQASEASEPLLSKGPPQFPDTSGASTIDAFITV